MGVECLRSGASEHKPATPTKSRQRQLRAALAALGPKASITSGIDTAAKATRNRGKQADVRARSAAARLHEGVGNRRRHAVQAHREEEVINSGNATGCIGCPFTGHGMADLPPSGWPRAAPSAIPRAIPHRRRVVRKKNGGRGWPSGYFQRKGAPAGDAMHAVRREFMIQPDGPPITPDIGMPVMKSAHDLAGAGR